MAGRLRRLGIFATGALAVGLSGCALLPGGDSARLHEEAQADLARWADAVAAAGGGSSFVPVGELTGQVGDWELDVGENNKSALMAGMVEAAVSLPADPPPDGEVRWPDGSTTTVRLVSAPEALTGLKADAAGSACPDCTTLQLTRRTPDDGPGPDEPRSRDGTGLGVHRAGDRGQGDSGGGRCRGHRDASALGSQPRARRHLDRVGDRDRSAGGTSRSPSPVRRSRGTRDAVPITPPRRSSPRRRWWSSSRNTRTVSSRLVPPSGPYERPTSSWLRPSVNGRSSRSSKDCPSRSG